MYFPTLSKSIRRHSDELWESKKAAGADRAPRASWLSEAIEEGGEFSPQFCRLARRKMFFSLHFKLPLFVDLP
jgi:hypothetical protein